MWFLLGCGTPEPVSSTPVVVEVEEVIEPLQVTSAKSDLRMKRWRQLSLDLQGALELTPDQVCKEAGLYDCMTLHTVPLGGLSVENGLFEASQELTVTTSLAVERVVLNACTSRLLLDRELEEPTVFFLEPKQAQVTELYQRLLARDATEDEAALLVDFEATVLEAGGDTEAWALLSCFTIGTSTEALLY
jgi:hypothetical protein